MSMDREVIQADPGEAGTVRIRTALLEDLPDLVKLEQACFAIPWSRESLRADLENPAIAHYWVAETPRQGIVGYVACYRALDTAQINNLAVSPACRHQGIGQALLEALLAWATEHRIGTLDLEVRPSNAAAIHLYQKMGFIQVGVRRAYYADNNEDANIMLKNLS